MFFSVTLLPKAASACTADQTESFVSLDSQSHREIARTKWVVGKVVAVQVCLEQRRHLRVARSGAIEDEEVQLEAEHVDRERERNQAHAASYPVADVDFLEARGNVSERQSRLRHAS